MPLIGKVSVHAKNKTLLKRRGRDTCLSFFLIRRHHMPEGQGGFYLPRLYLTRFLGESFINALQ